MPLGGTNAALIVSQLEQGKNNSEISRATGAHKSTVRKVRLLLEKARGVEFLCQCGRRADHREPCDFRLTWMKRPAKRRPISSSTTKFFQMLAASEAIKK
jgi:hypothetical protein